MREKETHLRLHLKPALGELPLDQVRGEVIDRFFASLAEKGLSPKSRKNVRATLRRILASAVEWDCPDGIPRLPRIKVPDPTVDHFSLEEASELLAAARNEEERLLLMFAHKTGARAGEQLALEWGDVDFRNGFIVIRRSSTRASWTTPRAGGSARSR